MTDAADDDPAHARRARDGRRAGRGVRAHRQARRPAARRGDRDQGSVRHVRHAHDVGRRRVLRQRSAARRRHVRRSGCATPARSSSRRPTSASTRTAARAARSAARSATPTTPSAAPSNSSAGSGSSVAANLVTCAIAEETGSSIRGPARANNAVGIAPTQELISRDGMIQPGINTRVGPDLPHGRRTPRRS